MNIRKSIMKRVDKLVDNIHRRLAPPPLRTYDHVFSLGFNCEVAFQFLKYNGFLESNILNWFYTDSSRGLHKALDSFDSVGVDFVPDGKLQLWKDSNHSLWFHGRGNHRIWEEGADLALLEADKEELISRAAYLKEKFLRLTQSNDSILFVYKPPMKELAEPSESAANLIAIRKALADLGFRRFDFMVIVTHDVLASFKKQLELSGADSHIIVESIGFHAPLTSVTDGPYDIKGWRRIWSQNRSCYKATNKKKKYKFNR